MAAGTPGTTLVRYGQGRQLPGVIDGSPRFFFDFVDPLSYLVELELVATEIEHGIQVERVPLELRPPPAPLRLSVDEPWRSRWELARELAQEQGVNLDAPALVPWSRKAHELFLHARAEGAGPAARAAIFGAFFGGGADIGRVDVLVGVGRSIGLDATGTKAVLDVDRHQEDVLAARRRAAEAQVEAPPLLLLGPGRLEGFHNRATLSTFLAR
jgi:predicted DsbA family dithiol-disulfide isomerase